MLRYTLHALYNRLHCNRIFVYILLLGISVNAVVAVVVSRMWMSTWLLCDNYFSVYSFTKVIIFNVFALTGNPINRSQIVCWYIERIVWMSPASMFVCACLCVCVCRGHVVFSLEKNMFQFMWECGKCTKYIEIGAAAIYYSNKCSTLVRNRSFFDIGQTK